MTQEDTIRQLNELIQVCRDGEQGFRTAAEQVRNTELETMFSSYAKERAEFVRELEAEVKRLGGATEEAGTLSGALHRGWMDVKSALSGGDAGAMIAACETGEAHAEEAYSRAIHTYVSGKSRSLIDKQWQRIKEAHARIHRLMGETKDGTEFPRTE